MDTVKFIFKRVLMAIFTIFVAATITFFLMKLVPGSPFASEKANEIAQQALNENMVWTNQYLSNTQYILSNCCMEIWELVINYNETCQF